jgi:hypothetical protein
MVQIEQTPRLLVTALSGACLSLATLTPAAIGPLTYILGWNRMPFQASLALFIVVWVAAIQVYAVHCHKKRCDHALAKLHQSIKDVDGAINTLRGEVHKEMRGLRIEQVTTAAALDGSYPRAVE